MTNQEAARVFMALLVLMLSIALFAYVFRAIKHKRVVWHSRFTGGEVERNTNRASYWYNIIFYLTIALVLFAAGIVAIVRIL